MFTYPGNIQQYRGITKINSTCNLRWNSRTASSGDEQCMESAKKMYVNRKYRPWCSVLKRMSRDKESTNCLSIQTPLAPCTQLSRKWGSPLPAAPFRGWRRWSQSWPGDQGDWTNCLIRQPERRKKKGKDKQTSQRIDYNHGIRNPRKGNKWNVTDVVDLPGFLILLKKKEKAGTLQRGSRLCSHVNSRMKAEAPLQDVLLSVLSRPLTNRPPKKHEAMSKAPDIKIKSTAVLSDAMGTHRPVPNVTRDTAGSPSWRCYSSSAVKSTLLTQLQLCEEGQPSSMDARWIPTNAFSNGIQTSATPSTQVTRDVDLILCLGAIFLHCVLCFWGGGSSHFLWLSLSRNRTSWNLGVEGQYPRGQ